MYEIFMIIGSLIRIFHTLCFLIQQPFILINQFSNLITNLDNNFVTMGFNISFIFTLKKFNVMQLVISTVKEGTFLFMKKGVLFEILTRVSGSKLILLQNFSHLLYYFMDFISVIGTCKDSLASASHSDLISKFPESLWATGHKNVVLWVQKGVLEIWLHFNFINSPSTLYRYALICLFVYLFISWLFYSFIYLSIPFNVSNMVPNFIPLFEFWSISIISFICIHSAILNPFLGCLLYFKFRLLWYVHFAIHLLGFQESFGIKIIKIVHWGVYQYWS